MINLFPVDSLSKKYITIFLVIFVILECFYRGSIILITAGFPIKYLGMTDVMIKF